MKIAIFLIQREIIKKILETLNLVGKARIKDIGHLKCFFLFLHYGLSYTIQSYSFAYAALRCISITSSRVLSDNSYATDISKFSVPENSLEISVV